MPPELPFVLLLDLLLKSTVILLVAALLHAVFRRASAANRSLVASAVFATLLLLPFSRLISPRWSFALERDTESFVMGRLPPPAATRMPAKDAASLPVQTTAPSAARTPPSRAAFVIPWKTLALTAWRAGAALLLARRGLLALRLRAAVRRSRVIEDARLSRMACEVLAASGVRAIVRESALCPVPVAAGIARPVVLLPMEARTWSDALLSSALHHEIGHLRHRDCATRLLADVVCALYWPNPLVWLAARRMRLAQEQACDDLVLDSGTRADEYAGQLVDIVRGLEDGRSIGRHAPAMAHPSTIETRVRAIMDPARNRNLRVVRGALAGALFGLAALAVSTAAQLGGANEEAAKAVKRGVAFLAKEQHEDGSLGGTADRGSIGVTSLAGLALLGDGDHAAPVERIAKFILSCQQEDGFIGRGRPDSMYDHAYATLFLAASLRAATAPPGGKEALARAAGLICKSQGAGGGWRYLPTPSDGDVSVTSCQLMALAAARRAGVEVPGEVFERAAGFLKRCQNEDGGFCYLLPGGESAFARSAAALAASLTMSEWTPPPARPNAATGADYLLRFLPGTENANKNSSMFLYGQYHAGHALRIVGEEPLKRWSAAMRGELLATQQADGSWKDSISSELGTSLACLILEAGDGGRRKP